MQNVNALLSSLLDHTFPMFGKGRNLRKIYKGALAELHSRVPSPIQLCVLLRVVTVLHLIFYAFNSR